MRQLSILMTMIFLIPGQVLSGSDAGVIQGRVIGRESAIPVESANIILLTQGDSSLVSGAVSNQYGRFRLADLTPGHYFLKVRYVGYKTVTIPDLTLQSGQMVRNVGTIELSRTVLESDEVVVEGERPPIEYRADRRIIDVARFKTAESGFAVDILELTTSVEVDFEGNVSLRGSSNFTVQINGRPTVLDPQEALKQIPASMIRYIEVITNPTAKHSAEGGAGIINIIMYEGDLTGSSGTLHATTGLQDKYGANGTYSYSRSQFTLKIGGNYNQRLFSGTRRQERLTRLGSFTSYQNSAGSTIRGMKFRGFNLGAEYQISSRDQLSMEFRLGDRDFLHESDMDFTVWSDTSTRRSHRDLSEMHNKQDFHSGTLSYLHQFNRDGHELSGDLFFSSYGNRRTSTSRLTDATDVSSDGNKTFQSGPGTRIRFKTDYTLPLSGAGRLEIGHQAEITESDRTTGRYEYDNLSKEYLLQPQYSYGTVSHRNEQSLYSLYSHSWKSLSYTIGLRSEYTYRHISHPNTNATFQLDRRDIFPSIHASYALNRQQVMLSFSRRIDRPGDRDLEPFQIWEDAYNLRIGNPSLKPEYIDSYEMGFQTPLGTNYLNIELYYRVRHNVIEQISSFHSESVILHTPENTGTSYSYGTEAGYRFSPLSFWEVSASGNLRQYRIEGSIRERQFSREHLNWSGLLRHALKFGHSWQIHIGSRYQSGIVTAQGKRDGHHSTDLALQKSLFDGKLTASLQVRNLFNTADHESVTETEYLTLRTSRTRESPIIMVSLRMNLGGFSSSEPRKPPAHSRDAGRSGSR